MRGMQRPRSGAQPHRPAGTHKPFFEALMDTFVGGVGGGFAKDHVPGVAEAV